MKKIMKAAAVFMLLLTAALLLLGCAEKDTAQGGSFTLTVVYEDESTKDYTLSADAKSLADALLEEELISKEEYESGLITEIDGAKADYEADGAWWALCDGEGNMTSVGAKDIHPADGDVYMFVYTVN